ncbi:hypothetical protein GTW25_02695 [Aliihoeflea aestuarii]|uniref:hypothetical protein n=1 Tax=Aliihoeflea aestuarii TaxID=453840 RepID=UPI0020933F31|nr:hypothetical protein [Aliihoeflea aestuarii]MCO6389936.1 hypothetical protein [Aliihoeflea aestuarii]
MRTHDDIRKAETDAYAELKTAGDWVDAKGASLLAAIRKYGINHPVVDESYCGYRDKLRELDAATKRWRIIFDHMKKEGI